MIYYCVIKTKTKAKECAIQFSFDYLSFKDYFIASETLCFKIRTPTEKYRWYRKD